METSTCLYCKEIYTKKAKHQKYCSGLCNNRAFDLRHRQELNLKKRLITDSKKVEKTCLQCRKKFRTGFTKKMYCTGYCTRKANKPYVTSHRLQDNTQWWLDMKLTYALREEVRKFNPVYREKRLLRRRKHDTELENNKLKSLVKSVGEKAC